LDKPMTWQPEIDEINRRRAAAAAMGGEDRVSAHHQQGKLTARERLALLLDEGSFREFGQLMGTATYADDGSLSDFTPKGEVNGHGEIDGRPVVVTAGDFTVRSSSDWTGTLSLGAELGATRRAVEWRVPLIRLLDAVGGSVASFLELGRTYLPDGNTWTVHDVELLEQSPVVSAVMGSVAGLPAISACLAHFNVMVRGTAQLFPGGPPVVKAALGLDITKEELGGADVHTRRSGVVCNAADSEAEAIDMVRRFLSYLPTSVDEMAPRDSKSRREPVASAESLRDLVPRNPRQPFDVRALIDGIVDDGSFFEVSPDWGRSRITGLARIDGFPVGLMANNPRHLGGSTDTAAGEKAIRLIRICDQFHLPFISLADEPGFMVGPDSEAAGIERAGARLVWTVVRSRMPWATVVVSRLYGVGGQSQQRPTGMFRRFAWPSARWGSMHIAGGASAAFRRVIESAPDPEAKLAEIELQLQALASPFRTAEATGQDIIDPAETRERLVEFVRDAQRVLAGQLGPCPTPFMP
jgi:acetyl-CoA carboxylase carboxyltransferase component